MKRIAFSLLLFSLTFLDAGNKKTEKRRRQRVKAQMVLQKAKRHCYHPGHHGLVARFMEYDVTMVDKFGLLPVEAVLQDLEMSNVEKGRALSCLTGCLGCVVTDKDREKALRMGLARALPKP